MMMIINVNVYDCIYINIYIDKQCILIGLPNDELPARGFTGYNVST